jgi:glucose-1-phosphate thymidylyltransferase
VIGPYVSVSEKAQIVHAIVRDSIIDGEACINDVMLDKSIIGKDAVVRGRHSVLNVGDSSQVDLVEVGD